MTTETDSGRRPERSGPGRACPRCGNELAVIELRVAEGPAVLRACSFCEVRFWELDNRPVELEAVLTSVGRAWPRRRRST